MESGTYHFCSTQDNKVSIWSVAEQGMQDDYEGDPQLLCEYKHDGDVMDLQVSVVINLY